jgi:hypothetical protein
MKRAATYVCLCLFIASPAAAGDTLMSARELASFCSKDDMACEFYLQGVFDGLRAGERNGAPRLVCPAGEPNAMNLKTYFIAESLSGVIAGKVPGDTPAIDLVWLAFQRAMPCR